DRRGESPVRVIVCHWSRMRPVLRRKGQASEVEALSRGGATAMKRALPSRVRKPPDANRRAVGDPPARSGHWKGARAAYADGLMPAVPEMSKARLPSFSKPERRACSSNTSAAER